MPLGARRRPSLEGRAPARASCGRRAGVDVRRTKIVATIGPASASTDAMRAVIEAGADVVRLNAAHGDADTHTTNARQARDIAAEAGRVVGVLVDLPGPKMRTGSVVGDAVELESGQPFTLCAAECMGDATRASTTLPELARWVRPGDEIFLADGAIVLHAD